MNPVDGEVPHLGNRHRADAQSPAPGITWPPPPRLLGSYSQIHYGYLPDALVDLTGGVVTIIDLHSSPSDLLMAVKTAVKAGSMVTCATPKGVSRWGLPWYPASSSHLGVSMQIS